MKETDYIDDCLRKVEEKFNKSSHNDWTDGDYKKLARSIADLSGTVISTHTLKRLFGKIKYKKFYNPQEATRDALAKYIGFDSWEIYVGTFQTQELNPVSSLKTEGEGKQVRKRNIPILLLLTLIISVTIVLLIKQRTDRNKAIRLHVINTEGAVPHTVTFKVNTEDFKTGSLILNYNSIHPYLGGEYIITDQKDSVINYTYQVPGVFRPKLFSGQHLIDSATIVAKTEGWVSFYHPEKDRHNYWLDNMYRYSSMDGFLSLTPLELIKYGKDTSTVYYTSHRNIRDFGLPGENFTLETMVLNNNSTGGISCYDINLRIICLFSSSSIRIVENNCQGFALLEFAENRIEGMNADLSFLTRNKKNWTIVRIETRDKMVDLYLDEKKVYSGAFKSDMGEIVGVEYRFKGSGKVDYLHLSDLDGKTAYKEEFGEEK